MLIRLRETTAERLEVTAGDEGYESLPADLRSETTSGEAFVYWVYGAEDALLYVGRTGNVDARLSGHRRKLWWAEVERVEVDQFQNRGETTIAEMTAIYEEEPKYNAPLVNGSGPVNREGSGRPVGRPKLDDPTVPIAFRMKRSAAEWWTEIADDRNILRRSGRSPL